VKGRRPSSWVLGFAGKLMLKTNFKKLKIVGKK
jgi:hypothetical protein